MASGAGVAGNMFDCAKLIKYEETEAAVLPQSGALFHGLRGTRRDRRQRREAAHPLAVTDHPREVQREASWGDGEAPIEIRAGQVEGRCVTADGTSEPSEKSKKQQADGQALMSGTVSDKVEPQTDGIEFTDVMGTGEVNREAKVVDGPGAGGFPFFAARLEDFRVKEVLEVAGRMARDTELQEDGETLTKKPAEKKARQEMVAIANVEKARAIAMMARCRGASFEKGSSQVQEIDVGTRMETRREAAAEKRRVSNPDIRPRRGEREPLHSPQLEREREAARQRAAARRRRETIEARAERLRANRQRQATRRQQETTQAREARRAAARLRTAAARQAARDAERTRRESETAVKRSDLANFDPDTPLEKLGWAGEEMQRNFQQPMSARTMRVCTVCSERWDTAEDGGGDSRFESPGAAILCANCDEARRERKRLQEAARRETAEEEERLRRERRRLQQAARRQQHREAAKAMKRLREDEARRERNRLQQAARRQQTRKAAEAEKRLREDEARRERKRLQQAARRKRQREEEKRLRDDEARRERRRLQQAARRQQKREAAEAEDRLRASADEARREKNRLQQAARRKRQREEEERLRADEARREKNRLAQAAHRQRKREAAEAEERLRADEARRQKHRSQQAARRKRQREAAGAEKLLSAGREDARREKRRLQRATRPQQQREAKKAAQREKVDALERFCPDHPLHESARTMEEKQGSFQQTLHAQPSLQCSDGEERGDAADRTAGHISAARNAATTAPREARQEAAADGRTAARNAVTTARSKARQEAAADQSAVPGRVCGETASAETQGGVPVGGGRGPEVALD